MAIFPKPNFRKTARSCSTAVLALWRRPSNTSCGGLKSGSSRALAETGICRDFLGPAAEAYQVIGTERWTRISFPGRPDASEPYSVGDLFWPSPAREERFLKFCLFHVSLGVGNRSLPSPQLHTPVEQRGYQGSEGIAVYTRIMTLNMRAPETAAHFNAAGSAGFYGAILSQDNQKLAQLSLQFLERASGDILKMPRWPLIWPELCGYLVSKRKPATFSVT